MATAVTIFNSPLLSARILLRLSVRSLRVLFQHAFERVLLLSLLFFTLTTAYLADGPHQSILAWAGTVTSFGLWWTALGIASSIGLGTGLHTFVLYLAPMIAKVTLIAYECNAIPERLPSRWNYQSFGKCPEERGEGASFWAIVVAVQAESFLWGVGTAVGELPPYFLARAAKLAGEKTQGVDDFSGRLGALKRVFHTAVKKYAFLTVLVCASVPNPFFDLAGILCGHFGVGFWPFFGATFIGKAVIKVHIQVALTVLLFSAHHLDAALATVKAHFPSLHTCLSEFLENQKRSLHSAQFPENKALLARLWELFILVMVAFFLVSALNSLVQTEVEKAQRKTEVDLKPMEVRVGLSSKAE